MLAERGVFEPPIRLLVFRFFFQAEDGIRDHCVTGVQTCALPIWTGRGDHAAAPCCTQSARSAFSWASKTTLPSTPAVRRPALTSVTRRTLTRALLRERSISFRSEERRVGKECRSRWWRDHEKKQV